MPRYFFHTEDGRAYPDHTGVILANDRTAQIKAVTILGELLKEDAAEFWDTQSFRITVEDETGLTLFTLDTSGVLAPSFNSRGR